MLQDRLILAHLRRTHTTQIDLREAFTFEEIQAGSLYKINDTTRIQFDKVMDDVWRFFLITSDGSKEIGRVYKVSENDYVSRSISAPNLEKSGKTMVDSALELCAMLGEI